MAHRALVAYERPDGGYDCHYAHDGAVSLAFRHRIVPETPFADVHDGRWTPRIDPEPRAVGVPFDAIPDHLDFETFEALYVVSLAWTVIAYLPLSFAPTVPADSCTDRAVGAFIAVSDDRDAQQLRRWFRATRTVVRDVVARGALAEPEAIEYLADRVSEWAGERREVVLVV